MITPVDCDDVIAGWTVADPAIAEITDEGELIALTEGETTVTVLTTNGLTAQCAVKVQMIPATDLVLEREVLNLEPGDEAWLEAFLYPEDTTDILASWTSSNTDVATVTDDGMVTALAQGSAVITATTTNGLTAECQVYVEWRVDEVTILGDTAPITIGETRQLAAQLTPAEALVQGGVQWTSSDEDIAQVDENGLVTALTAGRVTITATVQDSVSGSIDLRVIAPMPSMTQPGELTVSVESDETTLIRFTAPEDGRYVFTSLTDDDTVASLYDDPSMENESLAYDDDGGEDYNFCIVYELQAGQTVYLNVYYYGSSSGDMLVSVTKLPPEKFISLTLACDTTVAIPTGDYLEYDSIYADQDDWTVGYGSVFDGRFSVTAMDPGQTAIWLYMDDIAMVTVELNVVSSFNTFRMPKNLRILEADAFLGVNTQRLILPDGIEQIGAGALAASDSLRQIVFPAGTYVMEEGCIVPGDDLTIICPAGSSAEAYAIANGLTYVYPVE